MNNNDRVDILNGNITSILWQLCLPILISGAVQQLYNMIDLAIVGNVDEASVAIISGSSLLLSSVATNFIGGLISGGIVVVGNLYGEGNRKKVLDAVKTSYILMCALTLLFIFVYFVFARSVLNFMNVPLEILDSSSRYLQIYSLGFFGYGIFQLSINIMRSFGETRKPTILLISSFIINIIFDYIFIIGLRMSYIGVAVSYITSQLLISIVSVSLIIRSKDLDLSADYVNNIAFNMIKIGIPSAVISLAFSLTSTYVQSFFNLLGTSWISAYGIYAKFERIFWLVMNGLQLAFCTFVSQNYGAKQYDRIKRSVLVTGIIFVLATIGCSIVVLIGGRSFVSLFISSPETIDNCIKIVNFMAPFYPAYALIELFTAVFKGTKNPNIPLVLNILFICILRYLWLSQYAINNMSYISICMCWPISWVVSSIAYTAMYFIKKKKIYSN